MRACMTPRRWFGRRRCADSSIVRTPWARSLRDFTPKSIALDLRASGPDPLAHHPHLLALKAANDEPVIVDLRAIRDLGALGDVLRDAVVVGHGLRFTLSSLARHYDITPRSVWDTALAARLLDGGQHLAAGQREHYFSLAEVAHRELGTVGAEITVGELARVAHDVGLLLPLRDHLQQRITADKLSEALALELDASLAVADMTLAGVAVDRGQWEALVTSRQAEATSLRADIEAMLKINDARSTEKLLPALRAMSVSVERTSKDALAPHRHLPVISKLLRFRRIDAFVTGLGVGVLAALARSPDGRVRAAFDQLAAPTGRFGLVRWQALR